MIMSTTIFCIFITLCKLIMSTTINCVNMLLCKQDINNFNSLFFLKNMLQC